LTVCSAAGRWPAGQPHEQDQREDLAAGGPGEGVPRWTRLEQVPRIFDVAVGVSGPNLGEAHNAVTNGDRNRLSGGRPVSGTIH
jgi:hypothetical protein